jgi:glycosyltransferase involved in cell wall biosynthesis
MRLFAKHGVPCVLHNQNIFIDEAVFKPIAGEERKYQALYNAGLTQFKRHNLCTELDSLVLLYGRWHGLLSDENEYPRQVRAMLPKALFVNDSIKPGEYVGLLPHEVAVWYSRAQVGLCLSGNEGAMYASMEYLLSGLPIVSTPSRGGRDHFFDAETCLIVEPTPQAVAAGVAAMIARNLSPQFVRERTLEKVWAERRRFLNFLSAIFLDRGVPYPGETFWKSFFINKMIRPVRRSQLPNLVFLGF